MAWGYSRYLFDHNFFQRADLDTAAENAGAALYQGQLALDNIAQLRQQVLARRDQITELSVLVGVLVKLLAESGGVDEKVVRYRTEAALDAIAAEVEAKGMQAAAARQAEPQLRCVRCDRSVPARAITITADGNTCDRCAASGM